MELVLDNRVINSDIPSIIRGIKKLSPHKNLFNVVEDKGEYFRITCPIHKDGQESKPSCSIYARKDNQHILYGTCHCFTCGYKAWLPKLVSDCADIDEQTAKNWLIDNYSDMIVETLDLSLPIDFSNQKQKSEFIDESVLEKYKYLHPYMFKRRLTEDVIKRFSVGYDTEADAITFPVWDENNHLVEITRRYISEKRFNIESGKEKPVYLLNYLINNKYNTAFICESQINALTLWTYDLPGVALFGTGTKHQYEILNKCGIRNFVLCFDGDEAGRKGATRFKENMNKDTMIVDIIMPWGKDVNDVSKETFYSLLNKYGNV